MEKIPFDWEMLARYSAGDCSAEETAAIENWRQASLANGQYLERFKDVWQLAGEVPETFRPDAHKAWQKVQTATRPAAEAALHSPPTSRSFWYYASRVAAVLVLGILVVVLFRRENQPAEVALVEKISNRANVAVRLADGSRVWMNAGSRLRHPEHFDGTTREVYLEGEAYFEVTPDPQKPFIIHAARTFTKVLGTSFNVKAYDNDSSISVVVNTGKVSFAVEGTSNAPLLLTPGESGVWTPLTSQLLEQKADLNEMAWHTHNLVFRDASLNPVLETLNRYFGVSIRLQNPGIGNCHFTGTFKNAQLAEILEALKVSLGIEYTMEGNQIIISGTGC